MSFAYSYMYHYLDKVSMVQLRFLLGLCLVSERRKEKRREGGQGSRKAPSFSVRYQGDRWWHFLRWEKWKGQCVFRELILGLVSFEMILPCEWRCAKLAMWVWRFGKSQVGGINQRCVCIVDGIWSCGVGCEELVFEGMAEGWVLGHNYSTTPLDLDGGDRWACHLSSLPYYVLSFLKLETVW